MIIFLIIFLVLDGLTSRKNAKFRGSTYVPANDPNIGFIIITYENEISILAYRIIIFEFWDTFYIDIMKKIMLSVFENKLYYTGLWNDTYNK